MKKISLINAEHYGWGEGCDGWHLVRQPELSVIRERMPAGTSETRHFHRRILQFFHVLTGELTLKVGREVHRLVADEGLEVAPGQVHQACNNGSEPVEFLVISTGISRSDRIEQ